MRIGLITATGVALLTGLIGPAAALAGSGITGSAHDLRGRAVGAASHICRFCHIPETASAADPAQWASHALAADGFTPYAAQLAMRPVAVRPIGMSLVCLSCHDGAIAWNTFENFGVTAGVRHPAADHPVSVAYDPRRARFNAPSGRTVGGLPLFRASGMDDTADRVECPSCHNPHEIMFDSFLRISNNESRLCRTCHEK